MDRLDKLSFAPELVVITAPAKLRRARSIVATEDREARLIADAEKVERADYSFKNHGSLEELDDFVASVVTDFSAKLDSSYGWPSGTSVGPASAVKPARR